MEMVDIDDVKEGSILIEEVLNEQGDLLLKKGSVLTGDLINKLISLGILGVYVENAERNDSPDEISPEVSSKLKELEYRFSDVKDNAIMEELMDAAKEYIIEKDSTDGTS